ncbi:hybrid sensor histidine kinase/response regulator [Siccirubricoccus sp. G192]|uniref:hybrid sensor histidine kinase/response regulator n=1 Tax=Siccirubricoccus sp. G192 TaxID=2849651 RepID=UPI001C2C91E2|nr:hybrid sensor histidine kinase/response regulator [Siccirubricoccus sp. G192]MBV1797370.1 response regulator [Siccirubricoccus sp. G192]
MDGTSARPAPGRRRPPRSLRFMLAASLLVPALFLGVAAWVNHQRLTANADASLEQLSAVAREHALKVVETNALVLDRIEDRVRGLDWASIEAEGEAIQRDLVALDQRIEQITSLHLVRPDGRLALISIAWPTPPINLAGREDFRSLAAGDARGGEVLRFGPAMRGRLSGVLAFTMARARSGPDGQFDGMLLGSLLPAYFQQHWHTLDPEGRFTFRLTRLDGLVLAQYPAAEDPPATPPAAAEVPPALRRIAAGARQAGQTLADELSTFRRLGQHPLAVSVSVPLAAIRAEWLRDTAVTAFFCLLAAAALGFATLLAIRRWQSEQLVLLRLRETADELRAEIARRETAEAGLRQSQRLEALGRLTGGVAHDFNNLLTAILGTVHLLDRHLGATADDRVRRLLGAARDAVNRGARLNGSLLAFARRQKLDTASLDANELVQGFAPLIQRALGEAVTLDLALGTPLPPCRADASQLEAALLNLAINARDAMPRGGTVTLSTRPARLEKEQLDGNADAKPGDYLAIMLRDEGTGMPAEVRDRAFEPFFTTKPIGKGTGLGLSQVFGFIRQLGGHILIDTAPGQGTAVTLFLPVDTAGPARQERQDTPSPAAAPAPEGVAMMARATVLMAEDDERVREVTAETLRDAGFRVVAARDGQEALALLRRGEPCDLLFSDIVMPGGMTGIELAQEARRLNPGLPVLLATGYAGTGPETTSHRFEVIAKPYDLPTLVERIARLATLEAASEGAA